jgi:hypothetical protein
VRANCTPDFVLIYNVVMTQTISLLSVMDLWMEQGP